MKPNMKSERPMAKSAKPMVMRSEKPPMKSAKGYSAGGRVSPYAPESSKNPMAFGAK